MVVEMTEINYRLECLRKTIDKYSEKRIALYGIGANAKAILENFPEQNIVALLDENHIGEYIFGKKIISLNDVLKLEIEVIIIAAEALASEIISKRISIFCKTNSIKLLNMYGIDENKLKRQIVEQDLLYASLSEEKIYQQIRESDLICFQLMDVLCVSKFLEKADLFENIEKFYQEKQFIKNRMQSEKMLSPRQPYDIYEIYNKYWTVSLSSRERIESLMELEESIFVEGIIPHKKMVDILNRAFLQRKKIYIISDLCYSIETTQNILKKIGVKHYHGIVQENIANKKMSDGAWRIILGQKVHEKCLYIGTKNSSNLMLAQVYGMDICLIKTAWEIFWQFSKLNICQNLRKEKDNTSLWLWVQKTITSPFVKDNLEKINYVPVKDGTKNKNIKLFSLPENNDLSELDRLTFTEHEDPLVSIIIPVHNHFKYTYNCLKSIFYNTGDIKIEIIVADDASTDGTVKICDIVKGIKIIRNKKSLFFLRNCNEAAKHARGKYLVFLNNDTQVQENWLKPMIKILEEDLEVGLIGSKFFYPDGSLQEAGGIIWRNGEAANYGRGDDPDRPEYNYVREVDYITGASMVTRKTLWDCIGGFDERYAPAYCEDSDYAFEIRNHGKKVIYQPESVVVHFEGISNGKSEKEGIKKNQILNIDKFRKKWSVTLCQEHNEKDRGVFGARERKLNRKIILVFSKTTPGCDGDLEAKTLIDYLRLFLKKGFIVKLLPADFRYYLEYTDNIQQMGVEVLYGAYYKNNINQWILEHRCFIDYAFMHDQYSADQFIDIINAASIKIYENT